MRFNMIPLGMEAFTASNLSQWEIIKKTIDLSDYYILILGNRYGTIDPESEISYTEKEYRYALEQEIPCLAFLSKDVSVAPKDIESDTHREKLAAFRELASKARMVDFWTNPDELTAKAATSMFGAQMDSPRPGWIRNPQSSPEVAEELARLSRRNSELEREIERLKQDDVKAPSIDIKLNSLNEHGILYFDIQSVPKLRNEILESKRKRIEPIMASKYWSLTRFSVPDPKILAPTLSMIAGFSKPYILDDIRVSNVKDFLKRFNIDTEIFNWDFRLIGMQQISTGYQGLPISSLEVSGGEDVIKYHLFEEIEGIIDEFNTEERLRLSRDSKHLISFKLFNRSEIAARDLNITISFTDSTTNVETMAESKNSSNLSKAILSPGESINIEDFYYIVDKNMHFNEGSYEEIIEIKITGSNLSKPITFRSTIHIEVGQQT